MSNSLAESIRQRAEAYREAAKQIRWIAAARRNPLVWSARSELECRLATAKVVDQREATDKDIRTKLAWLAGTRPPVDELAEVFLACQEYREAQEGLKDAMGELQDERIERRLAEQR